MFDPFGLAEGLEHMNLEEEMDFDEETITNNVRIAEIY
jgi:hypothetical protein